MKNDCLKMKVHRENRTLIIWLEIKYLAIRPYVKKYFLIKLFLVPLICSIIKQSYKREGNSYGKNFYG